MDSSPALDMASSSPGGVATMPTSSIQNLMSASQGPRPLSSVFGYRPRQAMPRLNFSEGPGGSPIPHLNFSEGPGGSSMITATLAVGSIGAVENSEQRDDERKPAPREREDSSPNSYLEMPPGVTTASVSSDDTGIAIGAAVLPPPPARRRSSRKRRTPAQVSDDYSNPPPAKRAKYAAASPKTVAVGNLKTDPDENSSGSCCICMCDPDEGEASEIDGCDHQFCFDCIDKWSDRENTCPLCKERFTKIKRKTRAAKGKKTTKKVKRRDQRADLNPGNAIEGLLAGGFSPAIARLIFSSTGAQGSVIDFGANPSNHRRSTALSRYPSYLMGGARAGHQFQDNPLLHSDEEDEGSDDGFNSVGFSAFVSHMRRMTEFRSQRSSLGPGVGMYGGFSAAHARRAPYPTPMPPPEPQPRSYATNDHVANVGVSADNALEIADDSDDEVEVISVRAAGQI